MLISICKKQKNNGSVLAVVLFLLTILSIISIMGHSSVQTEKALAGNHQCTASLKANAESSALTGLQRLDSLISEISLKNNNREEREIDRRLSDTAWNNPERPLWLHRGINDCIEFPENLRRGDINNDGRLTISDGKTRLERARSFSRNYYLIEREGINDNWNDNNSVFIRTSSNEIIPGMKNARYMVIEYGIPRNESIKTGLAPVLRKKSYLITGVDKQCNGKYMVQIGYIGLVPVFD